jgi:glycosyltransferase involved in cell wall biosynthesis
MPKVSVCIPTYNRALLLNRTIETMLGQTYSDLEIIVCDDCSTDSTPDVIAAYVHHGVRYERNIRNLGLYANWNRCLELAHGEYVAIYHDHDKYAPTIVEESVAILDAYPDVGIVHTGVHLLTSVGQWERTLIRKLPVIMDGRRFAEKQVWRWDSLVAHATMMIRRSLYERVGPFNAVLGNFADMDMLIRYSLQCSLGYIAKPLVGVRGREAGTSPFASFSWSNLRQYLRVRERNLRYVYGDPLPQWVTRRWARQRDLYLLFSFMSLIVKGRWPVVTEGIEVLEREASPWAWHLGRALATQSRWTQVVLSKFVLPYRTWARVRAFLVDEGVLE